MKKLVVATRNQGKIRELELLLQGMVETVLPISVFPGLPDVVEDGLTFAENAEKKARFAAQATGLPSLADDSGLAVTYLSGRPGVYSARFAGEGAGDTANNLKLLKELTGIPPSGRNAAFHCVLAFALPEGNCVTFDGCLPGVILTEPRGEGGFGYDPLFLVPEYEQTLAQLSLEIKNRISHRGKALAEFRNYLEREGGNPLQYLG
jgi:XTP/dITP diphosphohydrolase